MSEPYMEEVVDEIDLDEDTAFTYGKLVLLADDRTMPQKAEDEDVVPEMQGKFKPENETYEGLFVVAYDDNNQQLAYEAYRLVNIKSSFDYCKKRVALLLSTQNPVLFHVQLLIKHLNNGMKVMKLLFLLVA
jgi:hypothetical protein